MSPKLEIIVVVLSNEDEDREATKPESSTLIWHSVWYSMKVKSLLHSFVVTGVQLFGENATSNAELNIRAQKGFNYLLWIIIIIELSN